MQVRDPGSCRESVEVLRQGHKADLGRARAVREDAAQRGEGNVLANLVQSLQDPRVCDLVLLLDLFELHDQLLCFCVFHA